MEHNRVCEWLDKILIIVFFILCLSAGISEALARNCVRVILPLTVIRCILEPAILLRLLHVKYILISMALFLAVMIASAIYGGNFSTVIEERYFLLQYSALLMPAYLLVTSKKRYDRALLYTLFASLFISNLYVFYQTANGDFRPYLFVAPSVLATTCIYCILIPVMVTATFDIEAPITGRAYSAVCAVMSVAGLMCTNTRGGYPIILVVVFLIFYYLRSWKGRVAAVLCCLLVVSTTIILVPSISNRVNTLEEPQKEQSVTERFIMWETAVEIGIDHPVLGVGKGNYSRVYNEIYKHPEAKESPGHAHSNYFMMLGENGVPGFLTYCAVTLSLLIYGWKRRCSYYGMMIFVATLGFAMYSITDYTLTAYAAVRLYWLLIGICVAHEFFLIEACHTSKREVRSSL